MQQCDNVAHVSGRPLTVASFTSRRFLNKILLDQSVLKCPDIFEILWKEKVDLYYLPEKCVVTYVWESLTSGAVSFRNC
jgi:hypothetical protein